MNFNKTALALAVAGITAAPIAAQADPVDIYASVRIGIWSVDQGGVDNIEVRSFSSRFGVKAETDLGNGMTGFGRYEWDVDENDFNIRQRIVGVKGD
ncbi:MAG: porin, partial [Gammaproteobacteria bacterium]